MISQLKQQWQQQQSCALHRIFTCWLIASMSLDENRAVEFHMLWLSELNQEQNVHTQASITLICYEANNPNIVQSSCMCHSVEDSSKGSSLFWSRQ